MLVCCEGILPCKGLQMSYRKQLGINEPLSAEEQNDFRYLRWLSPVLILPAIVEVCEALGLIVVSRTVVVGMVLTATACVVASIASYWSSNRHTST
jgi:CHASE3 domain sensor protein